MLHQNIEEEDIILAYPVRPLWVPEVRHTQNIAQDPPIWLSPIRRYGLFIPKASNVNEVGKPKSIIIKSGI